MFKTRLRHDSGNQSGLLAYRCTDLRNVLQDAFKTLHRSVFAVFQTHAGLFQRVSRICTNKSNDCGDILDMYCISIVLTPSEVQLVSYGVNAVRVNGHMTRSVMCLVM